MVSGYLQGPPPGALNPDVLVPALGCVFSVKDLSAAVDIFSLVVTGVFNICDLGDCGFRVPTGSLFHSFCDIEAAVDFVLATLDGVRQCAISSADALALAVMDAPLGLIVPIITSSWAFPEVTTLLMVIRPVFLFVV